MENIILKTNSLQKNIENMNYIDINQDELKRFGLIGIELRDYQLDGINWLIEKKLAKVGCILADEMGLGKTIQTISLLIYLYGSIRDKRPSLIIAPMSVVNNWKIEFSKFAPNLFFVSYLGNKDERGDLRNKITSADKLHVIISTYEICLKDEEFLSSLNWFVLVVDEAHRLKNNKSLLHITLKNFDIEHRLLLTGTPIQNNLNELYSLLSFCNANIFSEDDIDEFVAKYKNSSTNLSDLNALINPFILRRLKWDVITDLPTKSEIILFHGLSALQKKYYKAILLKDLDVFKTGNKTRLLNVLSQLRKCACHPYLFDGIEPEPFELGEHLVEASCKLIVLDNMLMFLKKNQHKVLIFSQMTRHLDILQDYFTYRGYSYERLDGSIRAEERYFSISRFNDEKSDVFAFLLSTRAGGQGLNLTSADTVLILDSDFNPQNDLQAASRAHRIGQTRNVKVIRFVCRDSVEEMIIKRAHDKLILSHQVMDDKNANSNEDTSVFLLTDILKFGLEKILSNSETDNKDEINFEKIIGKTIDGKWLNEDLHEVKKNRGEGDADDAANNMYIFEGQNYFKSNSKKLDDEALARLLDEKMANTGKEDDENLSLRRGGDGRLVANQLGTKSRPKKIFTEEEIEERKKKQFERKQAMAKLSEKMKLKRADEKREKRLKKWNSNNYTSCKINEEYDSQEDDILSNDDQDDVNIDDDYSNSNNVSNTKTDVNDDATMINYLIGDVTRPIKSKYNKNVILHCVDNSGRWGSAGVFKSIDLRSKLPSKQYLLASQMRDLDIGDVHLINMKYCDEINNGETDKNDEGNKITDYLALLVVQSRNRKNTLSPINIPIFENTLKIVSRFAFKNKACVHLPRIGDRNSGGGWYATERLVRKHLAAKCVPTFIYYYPRNSLKRKAIHGTTNIDQNFEETSCGIKKKFILPNFLDGKHFTFNGKFPEDLSYLKRQIIAFGGDFDENISSATTHLITADDDASLLGCDIGDYKLLPINELKICIEKKSLK